MRALPESDAIAELLKRAKTIAVVGLSDNPFRASHGVSAYMQSQGYHIIPVNPHIASSLGEKAYASLLDLPEKVDIVNVFRRSEFLEEIVEQAIQLKVAAVWAQEGVIDLEMQVGEVTQQVTVTAETPVVNTTTSQLSGLVGEQQVKDLPLNGRSFDNLITLNPGAINYTALKGNADQYEL